MSVKLEHHSLIMDNHDNLQHHSPTAKKPVRLFNKGLLSPNKKELKVIV